MQSFKKDFPIFIQNPDLVYLDSASTAQKPSNVIEWMRDFLQWSYANIHRGAYQISEQAEDLYIASKEKVASMVLGCEGDEIIYTYNATYAYNMLAESLWYSWVLKAGDSVLIDVAEHHANIVPRQMLSQRHGIVVEWVEINSSFGYDLQDFQKKYHDRVKVVSISAASNVTWARYNIAEISALLRPETFFIIDWSQAIPHGSIDVKKNRIDALVFTWHKIMADTWLWILYLAKHHIKNLVPARGGGWMIEDVQTSWFKAASGRQKFEPWTPHIVWAVSLLKALEYIESIGWFATIQEHEKRLVSYALERFAGNKNLKLLWVQEESNRLWIFSFILENTTNNIQIGEKLALENICVRCGGHCTHPLFHQLEQNGSCRASTYIYTDREDLEKLFNAIERI
jgi:cysteine desulfurase/selenocysteine lyase